MMILHVGGKGAYDVPMITMSDIPFISLIHPSFKLCVGIFTFMIGYGYAFAKVKDWRYSVKHIWALLKVFWLVLIVITIPTILLIGGGKSLINNGLENFIQELCGVSSKLNWYSWFVYLFIFAMIVMPFMSRVIDRKPLLFTAISIVVFYIFECIIHTLIPDFADRPWIHALFFCCEMMPTILLGYYFSKAQVFSRIQIPKHWSMAVVSLLIILLVLILRAKCGAILGFNFDFLYAPIAILSILVIFNVCKVKYTRKVFISLGNASVYMWFLHALFFTSPVRSVYQPMITISNNIWIVTLWAIVLTFTISWMLKKVCH